MPTEAPMRTDRARGARGRGNTLWDFGERNHLNVLPAPMGHPAASKGSACHIYPACGWKARRAFARQSKGQAAGGGRDFLDELDCPWLLAPNIAHGGYIPGSSPEGQRKRLAE
jgi:hypothetical protein